MTTKKNPGATNTEALLGRSTGEPNDAKIAANRTVAKSRNATAELPTAPVQAVAIADVAARRLQRRYGLPQATARAVVQLVGWGRAQ